MKKSTRELILLALRSDETVSADFIGEVTAVMDGKEPSKCLRLLTMAEAARELNFSRTWFWKKVKREGNQEGASFPPVEIAPGEYRYRLSDIEAFGQRTSAFEPRQHTRSRSGRNKNSKGKNNASGN